MHRPANRILALLICCGLFFACSEDSRKAEVPLAKVTEEEAPRWVEKGDLEALKLRGILRILVPSKVGPDYLPRGCAWHEDTYGIELAKSFAESLGLRPLVISVKKRSDMIPLLLAGKGDLVAASLTVTEERKAKVAFSVPLKHVRQQLVIRSNEAGLKASADLAGKKVSVRKSSSYWNTLEALGQKVPGIKLLPAEESLDTKEIIYQVARGLIDATVADDDILRAVQEYCSDVKAAFDLSGDLPNAWAIRPDAEKLLERMNAYITEYKLSGRDEETFAGDLDGIKERGVLRVLTRNNAATYFIYRGRILGFEYDLAKHFAESLGLRLEIVVPPSASDLIPWLLEGKGDMIAASMTINEKRKKQVAFSSPYNQVDETIVAANCNGLSSVADLSGRTLVVRKSSSYWSTLEKLKAEGATFTLQVAPEEFETEEIIAKVSDGVFDLTLADSHILDLELTWRDDIKGCFSIGDKQAHGWALRPGSGELLAAVNAYFKKEYRGLYFNMKVDKYFKNARKIKKFKEMRADLTGGISPFDELVIQYSDRYKFDWKMIVAQMHQESRFDPNAKSWAGALGLMQVMPTTGAEMGFKNLSHPESGIHAGTKYLSILRKRFDLHLPVEDRLWFALASYNAGYGHVRDARLLAEEMGLSGERWFDNVEQAILLLSKREYANKARYGYCRGQEPVAYIREIHKRYQAYQQLGDE